MSATAVKVGSWTTDVGIVVGFFFICRGLYKILVCKTFLNTNLLL